MEGAVWGSTGEKYQSVTEWQNEKIESESIILSALNMNMPW